MLNAVFVGLPEQKGGKSSPTKKEESATSSSPDAKRKSPKAKATSNTSEQREGDSPSGKASPKDKSNAPAAPSAPLVNGVPEDVPSRVPADKTPVSEAGPPGMDFNLEEFLRSDTLPILSVQLGSSERLAIGELSIYWF